METYIKASLDAFNVSKNCDRSSNKAFYDSYLERKKKVIAGKMSAYKEGKPINQRKLQWELLCYKQVSSNKWECLEYIDSLIKSSSNKLNKNILDIAERILEDTPNED